MKKTTAIVKLMATARALERGDLYPEGAEADFSYILDEYVQKLVEESDSLPCVIALLDSLGDFNNEYSVEYHKSDSKWWIIHKEVGSGCPLEQWLTPN